jgi:hypothetical protein
MQEEVIEEIIESRERSGAEVFNELDGGLDY